MKTIEEVELLASRLKALLSEPGGTVGRAYLTMTDRGEPITPEDYVGVLLVALGVAIPEVVTEAQYVAVEHIRFLSISDQVKYLRSGESFDLVVRGSGGEFNVEKRTYRELGERDCLQIFDCGVGVENARLLIKGLKNPDPDFVMRLKLQ